MSNQSSEILAANVRALIKRVGSGSELARITGVPQKTISRIVNDENAINLDTLTALAEGAGLQPWQLLVSQLDLTNPPLLFQPDAPRCPTCLGNDREAFCAYPGEDQPGCLRQKRLKLMSEPKQERRIAELEQICAAAYQLAGVVGAPVRFLDALALHDDVDVDSLLPVRLEECDEFQRLRSQLNKAEVERAWALRGRTFVTPDPQS